MTDPIQPSGKCHCGRQPIVNETLGYSRGLCGQCDIARCDAYPDDCPHELRTPREASEGASRLLNQMRAKAWDEGYRQAFANVFGASQEVLPEQRVQNPYRSES